MRYLILAFLITTSGWALEKPPRTDRALGAAVYAAAGFDAGTTYSLLNSCSQCYEANPVLRPVARTPAIFPVLLVTAWGVNRLAARVRPNHPRWSRVIQVSAIGLHAFAGAHNLEVIRQTR